MLPRGLYGLLTDLVESAGSTLHIDDKRAIGDRHESSAQPNSGPNKPTQSSD